ncbi:hypothetical protein [Pedomonas mirosovicensis]|nr:hypothetical protein [Pedomonas mirosovicensis]MCH8685290.1 hypothetical protein [Pedomonas mirosovicensis]
MGVLVKAFFAAILAMAALLGLASAFIPSLSEMAQKPDDTAPVAFIE